MKKKLVTALVLASMISGVSAVYADYTDQEIDTKVNEIKEEFNGKYTALDGKVNNLTQGVEANTGKIAGIEQKQQVAEGKFTSFEEENRNIKEQVGKISNGLETEKTKREEEDGKLSTNIEGVRNALGIEKTNRETKDNELDGKISAETQARTQLDQRLSDRLDQGHDDLEKETKERKEEDTKIRGEFAKADDKVRAEFAAEDTKIRNEIGAAGDKIRAEFAAADQAEKDARVAEDKKIRAEFAAADKVLGQRIDRLAIDTDKGLAKVSALAGLHPLDYDPANKLNVAAAGGSYNGEHAFALGAFYRPNRNIMLSLGSTITGGDNAYNVGISVKVGKGGDRINQSNTTISELYDLVGRLQDQVAAQQKKIEELQAK